MFTRFVGYGIKIMDTIFKTKMLIYQSKANLDENILFGKSQIFKTQHPPRKPGGGGNLSFQDTRLCHSNRKSTTHKSGKLSQKYTHKSGEISQKYTHKSGEFLKIIPINPGMPKRLTNN